MSIPDTVRQLFRRLRFLQQRQKQRKQLIKLDNHILKDLGLSRADALREGSKTFWQS